MNSFFNPTSRISFGGENFSAKDFIRMRDGYVRDLKSLASNSIILSQLGNHPAFFALTDACLHLGLVHMPVDQRLSETEVERLIEDVAPAAVVRGTEISFNRQARPFHNPDERGGMVFLTSGSSGRSKYIYHPFSHLFQNAERAISHLGLNKDSRSYVAISLAHTGGMNMLSVPTLVAGGVLALNSSFSPGHFSKGSAPYTHAVIVPPQLRVLMKSKNVEHFPQKIITGSTPLSSNIFMWGEKQGIEILGVYGMTEIGPFICTTKNDAIPTNENEYLLGKMIAPFEAQIRDGEIHLKGPGLGRKLILVDEEWHSEPLAEEWYPTGDLGVRRGDTLWMYGRKINEINCGGHKFSAEEVEQQILKISEVQHCAIVSESHPTLYQVPVAYIVADPQFHKKIKSDMKAQLASFKCPRQVHFVSEIPRAALEKTSYSKVGQGA